MAILMVVCSMGLFTSCQKGMDEANAIVGNYNGSMTTSYLAGTIAPTTKAYTIALNMDLITPGQFWLGVVTFQVDGITIPAVNLPCTIAEAATGGGYTITGNGPIDNITIKGYTLSDLKVGGTIINGKMTLTLDYSAAGVNIVSSTFTGTK